MRCSRARSRKPPDSGVSSGAMHAQRPALDPRRDARRHRQARDDLRRGAPVRPVEAVLGRRRQRTQPGRRRGDPDQAQRALLQVDRLRRHRGQEAHRSVIGAADPRLRGGFAWEHGRRCRQGDGDLPFSQGDPDRGGRRGRHSVRVGGDDLRPAGRPRPRLHPVGNGGPHLRVRSGAGDRRVGAAPSRSTRSDRACSRDRVRQ